MCRVITVSSQKGGVGKTATCVNLGIGLARAGKKVLLVEADAQGNLAASLGIDEPDELEVTLAIPANIELAGVETALIHVMSWEMVLRQYLDNLRNQY